MRWVVIMDEGVMVGRETKAACLQWLEESGNKEESFVVAPASEAQAIGYEWEECPACGHSLRWVDDSYYCPECESEWSEETIDG